MTDHPNNRLLYAYDCLDVLNDELEFPNQSIDLIYLDPPFNSNSKYNLPVPFKREEPVQAFQDTWVWKEKNNATLEQWKDGVSTDKLYDIVRLAQKIQPRQRGQKDDLSAYLFYMAERLMPMKRVLKETGSIYLHCDPKASHYLKMLMDVIFGKENFQNEIVWSYKRWTAEKFKLPCLHDIILCYRASLGATFNPVLTPNVHPNSSQYVSAKDSKGKTIVKRDVDGKPIKRSLSETLKIGDVWEMPIISPNGKERLGYATQKPLKLLERIILASTNPGDTVLDPFCGCGTSIHAAEKLKRKWIGIDIAPFSAGLVRTRVVEHIDGLKLSDITMKGLCEDQAMARERAQKDPFEFEKCVCGMIGCNGMYKGKRLGDKGKDGGVDGVIEVFPMYWADNKQKKTKGERRYVIVQVKGGKVTPDHVKALRQTVDDNPEAVAGVFVYFKEYKTTVENNRSKDIFEDAINQYPLIQGLSIEDLLAYQMPDLPHRKRHMSKKPLRLKGGGSDHIRG